MIRDAQATKRRLLESAETEFAASGIAGARVDRIAINAGVNKQLIYAYFGSKEQLFDRILDAAFARLVAAVPLVPRDLPTYAGNLFEYLMSDATMFRLMLWRRLERPEPSEYEQVTYLAKAEELRSVNTDGADTPRISPMASIALIHAICQSFLLTPLSLKAYDLPRQSQKRLMAVQRSIVTEAVSRILAESTIGAKR